MFSLLHLLLLSLIGVSSQLTVVRSRWPSFKLRDDTPVVHLRRVHEFRYRQGAAPRAAPIGSHLEPIRGGWGVELSPRPIQGPLFKFR